MQEKKDAKLQTKKKDILLIDMRSTSAENSIRMSDVSMSSPNSYQTQDFPMASLKKEASNLKANYKKSA
jgi:hypothetical protein